MSESTEYSGLSDGEREWIDAHLRYAASLQLDPADVTPIGEFFDSSLAAITSGEQAAEDANAVVNIVAVLLGEHLCGSTDLEWAIISDEYGTDLCIHDPQTSWTFFPQSSVAKRWEAQESGWVVPFVTWAKDQAAGRSR